jgi:sn-glycerol 3-phosphate transport system substrate-binding protein
MRRTTRHTLLALAVLVAVSCSGGGGGTGAGDVGRASGGRAAELPACPVEALDQVDGPVEVVVWTFLQARTGETLRALAEQYNASQSKVRVRVESQGTNNDEVWRKYQAGISTGDLPAIAILDDTVTVALADSGTVLPAQSCIDATGYDLSDFLQAGIDYYTIDGALYPASLNLSSALLYYNRNHFRRAGLDVNDTPRTLAELRETAQRIRDAGVVDTPVVLNLGPPLIEMWLTGAGVPIVDNDNGRGEGTTTRAAFDTPTTVELYTWVRDMVRDGLLRVVPNTPGQIDHYLAMAQQNASMTIETSTAATSIEAFLSGDLRVPGGADAADVDLGALDIGAAAVPGLREPGRLQMGGGAWYLTNTAPPEVQAAAWDFIRFVNSVPSQVRWNLEGGYLPFNVAATRDPAVVEQWSTTLSGRWLALAYDELLDGVDPNFPGPLIGPYDEFRAAIRRSVDSVVFAGVEPDVAVREAAAATTAAIERYEQENF